MATKRQIAKYTLLPGILPRLEDFFRSGFAHVAFLMAVIYEAVKLLPPDHPYLYRENFGKYGIIKVMAAAANNLSFSRNHIDQIAVFMLLLGGYVILLGQIVVMILSFVMGQAVFAQVVPGTPAIFNPTPYGTANDMAFMLLDQVFGLTSGGGAGGFFGSCVGDPGVPCEMGTGEIVPPRGAFPWPFHMALHKLFQFYSMGIFIVGVLIIIYYVITIVAETAQTGTPFGQRTNRTWAPVRLILFLGLLLPIGTGGTWHSANAGSYSNGLNSAQLILLQVVKWGSNLASNGWLYYAEQFQGTGGARKQFMLQGGNMIALPNIRYEDVENLVHFMAVAHTCRAAYHASHDEDRAADFAIRAYIVRSPINDAIYGMPPSGPANYPNSIRFDQTNYQTAVDFSIKGDITVRFGTQAPYIDGEPHPDYKDYKGLVRPYCGEMGIPIFEHSEPGPILIQQAYYQIAQQMWADPLFSTHAQCMVATKTPFLQGQCTDLFDPMFLQGITTAYYNQFNTAVEDGVVEQEDNGMFGLDGAELGSYMGRGWAGAGLWYNKIAKMNGAVIAASNNIPDMVRAPELMVMVLAENQRHNANVTAGEMYSSMIGDEDEVHYRASFLKPHDYHIFHAMIGAQENAGDALFSSSAHTAESGNVFIDFVNMIMGTSGVFEMRKNREAHPLAQLSALGRGMMDAVVRNAAIATGLRLGKGLFDMMDEFSGVPLEQMQEFFTSLVAMTTGMAVILYYVLPLMPFLYFMFAVSGWLKSIFEAMVAMPLWALAHLRIDGEGVMGPGALNGYVLILEIFLRPILILAGMLASLATFSSLIWVLNLIFGEVVSNVAGHDITMDHTAGAPSELEWAAGEIDIFFFTAMYTIICYMMALSSFKLVDMIPHQILRWMGVSTSTFQEGMKDPVGQLSSQVQRGSILVTNQLRDRGSGLAEL